MTVIEVLSFSASGRFIADPTLGEPVYQYLKEIDGCLGVHYGFQAEEKTRLVILITWAAYEHYQKMTQRDDYASFISSLPTNLASSLTIQVFKLNGDPSKAIESPTTSTYPMVMQEGLSEKEVNAILSNLNEMFMKFRDREGMKYPTKVVWGPAKDLPDSCLWLWVLGWQSVEENREFINGLKQSSDLVPAIQEAASKIADLHVRHVTFKRA